MNSPQNEQAVPTVAPTNAPTVTPTRIPTTVPAGVYFYLSQEDNNGMEKKMLAHRNRIIHLIPSGSYHQKNAKGNASAGNRTRGVRMASGHFTTKPLMLLDGVRCN
jgi:hypothetical protein